MKDPMVLPEKKKPSKLNTMSVLFKNKKRTKKLITLILEESGGVAAIYLSFMACNLATTGGRTEATPGMKLNVHNNSLSIQFRS